jgi:hypothetical protein
MNQHQLYRLNSVLEKGSSSEQLLAANEILRRLDVSEQMEIHNKISVTALRNLFAILHDVTLVPEAKEHITWYYFRELVKQKEGLLSDDLLEEIIDYYRRNKYLALESLVIEALKEDRITTKQTIKCTEVFQSRAFNKELLSFQCRSVIRNGKLLESKQVKDLQAAKAYSVLELAFDAKAISMKDLDLFTVPDKLERDRKIKLKLYEKA